ncbi:MAG: ComEC/Rec2 family competence protein [Bdellovibrionales bacterium]
MAARFGIFCLAFLLGTLGANDLPPELIVWNVGQGQWATIIDENICWHIDMGGEFAPWAQIRGRCRRLENRISLSHWDMDHIVFASSSRNQLPNLCLVNAPEGRSSPHKEAMILSIPKCRAPSPFEQWSDPLGRTANDKSWVILWKGVLAPGDSTRTEEKKWLRHIKGLSSVRFFILGHHGSRTSTSVPLLNSLTNLRFAISSARFRRYGHPHQEVVRELIQARIPLLRTEEWGTIHMRLD